MDLLRLPWNRNGQGRAQFPLDHLFRRDDNNNNNRGGGGGAPIPPPQAAERGGGHADGTDMDNWNQRQNRDYKVTSPLQKVLDGKHSKI